MAIDCKINYAASAADCTVSTFGIPLSFIGDDFLIGTQWTSMTDTEWVLDNNIDYTFTASGKYIVVVWVTDDPTGVDPNGVPIIGWSVDIK